MGRCRIRVALMSMAVVGAGVGPASAQAGRVAAFGNVALVDAFAGDTSKGGMAMYGGELVVSLAGTLRAGVNVETGRISRTDVNYVSTERGPFSTAVSSPFEFRQTAVTLSLFREWPRTARVRYLAGGGVGVLVQRLHGVYFPEMVLWSENLKAEVLYARGGIVGTVSRHLYIRAEATYYSNGGLWIGALGARAGVGYVF